MHRKINLLFAKNEKQNGNILPKNVSQNFFGVKNQENGKKIDPLRDKNSKY